MAARVEAGRSRPGWCLPMGTRSRAARIERRSALDAHRSEAGAPNAHALLNALCRRSPTSERQRAGLETDLGFGLARIGHEQRFAELVFAEVANHLLRLGRDHEIGQG